MKSPAAMLRLLSVGLLLAPSASAAETTAPCTLAPRIASFAASWGAGSG